MTPRPSAVGGDYGRMTATAPPRHDLSGASTAAPGRAGLALLAAGLLLGRGMNGASTAPDDDPESVGFARDLSVHHAQAVAMSVIAHRRRCAGPPGPERVTGTGATAYAWWVPVEEMALRRTFGEPYEQHRRMTPRRLGSPNRRR